MKKHLLYLIAIFVVVAQINSYAIAANSYSNNAVNIAIRKYKAGNYAGCLQSCQSIIARDPSNALAYYYMAISYVQAGKKTEAIDAYSKVLGLKPNARLAEYASTGKRCLETPDKCHPESKEESASEIDKFIRTSGVETLSDTVKKDIEVKSLKSIQTKINNGQDVDSYQLRKFNDYSKTQADDGGAVSQKQPTNDEIVAALKVLKAAGLDPYGQSSAQTAQVINPYTQAMTPADSTQNSQMAQMSMLLGGNNQSNGNNSMMNMLPFMLAQNKNGTSNYSPQLMQAVMMNSMMPDFNLDVDKDK